MSCAHAALLALGLCACATTPPPPPAWVALHGRYEADETPDCADSRFGVGGASGVRISTMRLSRAVSEARHDLTERLRHCWKDHLEGRVPYQGRGTAVTDEKMLEGILRAERDNVRVVHEWSPDDTSLFVYVEVPKKIR